jgi:dihydroorotate dehydrogenase
MTLVKEAKSKFGDKINIIGSGGISINNIKDYFTSGANYVQMEEYFYDEQFK